MKKTKLNLLQHLSMVADGAEKSKLENDYFAEYADDFSFLTKHLELTKEQIALFSIILGLSLTRRADISEIIDYLGCKSLQFLMFSKDIEALVDKEFILKLNNDGMRVLALAQKNFLNKKEEITVNSEKDMVLMGYLSFLDPPKQSAKSAIQALKNNNVKVKVLTGDSDIIAKCICKQVGIENNNVILGTELDNIEDKELKKIVEEVDIFAKLSPQQKLRIIKVLKSDGHTVGFMGDGINDAPAMKEADVAISVDSAVDIAKESADIILLKKDLNVLNDGVVEGRRIFCNIIKYIKMTISSNFGNILSILIASIFLPFLPILPVQILILNLLYDISQLGISWDNVDSDLLKTQKKWSTRSIKNFMIFFGPISTICDLILFYIMYNILNYKNNLFNSCWFVSSIITQSIIINFIRTSKIPFKESNISLNLGLLIALTTVIAIILPYT